MNGPNRDDWEHLSDIKGDHDLVTGGCGKFGLGIARAFLEQGKRVTLVDLNIEPGKALAAGHEQISLIELDLADAVAVEARLKPLEQSPGAPHVLVNGAGRTPWTSPEGKPRTIWEMPVEHFSRVLAGQPYRGIPMHRPLQTGHAGARIRAASSISLRCPCGLAVQWRRCIVARENPECRV